MQKTMSQLQHLRAQKLLLRKKILRYIFPRWSFFQKFSLLFSPHEFVIHSLNFRPCDKRFVSPEAPSEGMRNVQDLMDQHLGLIFSAKPIKPFGEDFNDIMRFLVKRSLHDSRKSVTAGNHSPAPGTFASQTDQPGLIDMGQLQFPEDFLHPGINIFGQMILNHTQEEMAAQQRFGKVASDSMLSEV